MMPVTSIRKSPEPGSRFVVLCIDDNNVSRTIFKRYCTAIAEQAGIPLDLHEAACGKDGQKLIQEITSAINFALVDFDLGDMLGTALCTEILVKNPKTYVTLFSASEIYEIEKEQLPEKVRVILGKKHEDVKAVLREAIEMFKINKQARKLSMNMENE